MPVALLFASVTFEGVKGVVRQRRIEIRRNLHLLGQETRAALLALDRDNRSQLGKRGAGHGDDVFLAGGSFLDKVVRTRPMLPD